MAKAKKQPAAQETTPAAPDAAPTPSAKKPAAKKAAKVAKAAAPSPSNMPMIDTSLAAQTAAKLVAHRDMRQSGSDENRQESSAFKQLKEGLSKAATGSTASFLQSTAPIKKQNSSFGANKQIGRNQTFGADVNRSGVPRRTGG